MAIVSPTFDFVTAQAAKVPRVTWAGIVTSDTITTLPVAAQAAVAGTVQFGGTFGGATVGLQVSNDNVTYFDMKDLGGTVISATANGFFEFTTSAMFLRPVVASGSANAINVTVVLRG